jgi:hypothetical protein
MEIQPNMKLIESDSCIATVCRELESRLGNQAVLEAVTLNIDVLDNFDNLKENNNIDTAKYQKSTKKVLVNRIPFLALPSSIQQATIAHEIGHAVDHRDKLSEQKRFIEFSDEIVVDLLVCQWGLFNELASERLNSYGHKYVEALGEWQNEDAFIKAMTIWYRQKMSGLL